MHTITTRSPNPHEQRLIARHTKPDVASWGCLIIFFGIAPAVLLGKLGGWLGRSASSEAGARGQLIGWAASVVLLVTVAMMFVRFERRRRMRAARDEREGLVQEIHVIEPRVIEIGLINDKEPILALDLADNKLLFLQGQWLRDPETYGAASPEGDPVDEFLNGLPAPHSFPSSEFAIARFPQSGHVLGIRVHGKYAAPQGEVEALRPEYSFRDSELLDGSLDDVSGVLKREHERRNAERQRVS